jgi:uncharacterized cupredoxin-like copper-binding protein
MRSRTTTVFVIAALLSLVSIEGASARPLHASIPKAARVTAGTPSEFAFKLSTHKVALGTVVFTVTNRGAIVHDFKVCSKPARNTVANTCNGKGTRKLAPGQSVRLRVTFKKKGSYAYLCTVTGHAAAGMKGLLKVA